MYLKSLMLRGFKTFADKTSIDFESIGGITAIVGPNGCGKSNLVDAIRWVLGELSLKDLRSSSLEEVIFAGSSARKPLSLAEVSIELDNSDHLLQTDYTQVSIRRRIYRSGESEFYINKNPCRLKDIRDLFLDTGLGKGTYSLINQGQVDAILSSSPEERRAPFEEAAGISKYKSRREAARRKLIATEQNLLRINDLKLELSSQLKNLEEQAGRAKEYKALKDKLKNVEIGLAKKEMKSLTGRRTSLLEKVNTIRTENQAGIDEVKKEEEKKESIKTKLKSIDVDIENINKRLEMFKEEIEGGRRTLAIEREKEKNLMERLSSAELETSKLEELLNIQREKLEEKLKESQASSSNLEGVTQKIAEKEKELESIIQKLDSRSNELSSIKNSIFEKERNIAEERNKLLEFSGNERFAREESRRDKKTKEELEAEKEKLEKSASEVAKKIEILKGGRLSLESKLDSLRKERITTDEEYQKTSKQKDEVKVLLYEKSSRLSLLNESKMNLGENTKELLKSHRKEVLGLITQLYKTEQRFKSAIEVALGQALQGIVTQNKAGTRKLLEHLREKELAKTSFFPLALLSPPERKFLSTYTGKPNVIGKAQDLVTFDKKHEKLFHSILGNVLVVEDLDTAFNLFEKIKEANPRLPFKLVTLSGDCLNSTGEVIGGGQAGDIRKMEEEIRSLEITVKDFNNKFEALLEKEKILEKKKKDELSIMDTLEKEINEKNIKLATVETQSLSLNSEIKSIDEELDLINQSLSAREAELSEIEKERESLLNHAKMLEEECKTLNDKLKLKGSEIELLSQSKDGANSKLTEIKIVHARISSKLSGIQDEISNLSGSIKISEKELGEKSKEVIEKRLQESREKIKALIENEPELESEKETLKKTLLEKKEEKSTLGSELENLERRIKDEGERERTIREQLLKEEVSLAKLEGELTALDTRMKEEYGLGVEEIMASQFEVQNLSKGRAEVTEFRSKIKELEPVNLLAIEEYEKAHDRLVFLETQSNDLASARENLKNLIEELDKKAKESFLRIFNLVAENFAKIFSLLFEGGEAKLILMEGEDPLEAGIEILAKPHGKKWLNLTLLSGGERALTAIAILFALLKTHPSPFCFLDEVDAALDEANIHRFMKLLREFSRNSQIIVITHNKRTMAIVDTIYGITMEEAGISKLISMKMAKVT